MGIKDHEDVRGSQREDISKSSDEIPNKPFKQGQMPPLAAKLA